MSVSAPLRSGTSVGPYVVERRLAEGGMSILYIARDADGTRLVLKMVSPDVANNTARMRLYREARALALVDHPGVVRVHGTGEHGGAPWIAMDLVHGTDMKRVLIERGPLPLGAALRYAIQATQALAAAHDAGVIHRDLKPSNVLLTPEGRIVLVDFGTAQRRAEARDGDVLTSAHEIVGTLAYLAPEQLDHGLSDERSDIWALGCLLFEMLVGAPPFGRGGSSTTAAILRDEPAYPLHLPTDVVHVISACLRKNSFARIASPRELLSLLNDAAGDPNGDEQTSLDRLPSSTRPASARASTRAAPAAPLSSRTSSPPASAAFSSRAPAPTGLGPGAPPRPSQHPSSRAPASGSSGVRAATPKGRIKGTALRAVIAWFVDTYGEAALKRAVERSSPALKAVLRSGDPALGVMASGWYDIQLVVEFFDVIEDVALPHLPSEFISKIGAAIARDNVGGVYRALFRLIASPSLLEANAQRVWQTYFDEGALTVNVISPGVFEARVRGWTHHHPTICRTVAPMIEEALRLLGYASLVVTRPRCISDGSGHCAFDGRWMA